MTTGLGGRKVILAPSLPPPLQTMEEQAGHQAVHQLPTYRDPKVECSATVSAGERDQLVLKSGGLSSSPGVSTLEAPPPPHFPLISSPHHRNSSPLLLTSCPVKSNFPVFQPSLFVEQGKIATACQLAVKLSAPPGLFPPPQNLFLSSPSPNRSPIPALFFFPDRILTPWIVHRKQKAQRQLVTFIFLLEEALTKNNNLFFCAAKLPYSWRYSVREVEVGRAECVETCKLEKLDTEYILCILCKLEKLDSAIS